MTNFQKPGNPPGILQESGDLSRGSNPRYLSADSLQSLQLNPREIAASIEHLLLGQKRQQAWNAPKAVITPPDGRYMMATLAAADDPPFLAVKALVLNPDNPKRGLASINALVTLLDSRSGLPLAVLDGNWVTAVRTAGLKVCCGGILGMGEAKQDRAQLLHTLATLDAHPESVPINQLVRVKGTPLEGSAAVDPLEFVRTVAVARILMPKSHVRLSAGREQMSDEMQALCFLAGANSIFYGEKLLTTGNPDVEEDRKLFARLGIRPGERAAPAGD